MSWIMIICFTMIPVLIDAVQLGIRISNKRWIQISPMQLGRTDGRRRFCIGFSSEEAYLTMETGFSSPRRCSHLEYEADGFDVVGGGVRHEAAREDEVSALAELSRRRQVHLQLAQGTAVAQRTPALESTVF